MCRIAGIVSEKISQNEIRNSVKLMCRALQHGGPDDEGIFEDEKASLVFGHRRLSIIDLSSNGHQPMADVGQNAWITFNGEIYNYPELRQELLRSGAQFKSGTDTEVILQAYLNWGTAAFARFRGMFAFALYDVGKALTYLVRDTTGIKPLYYSAANNELCFASEVRAFKQSGLNIEKDPDWPVRLLAFGHIPEPYTTLKNVFSLPKGHFLCWDHRSAGYTLSRYHIDGLQSVITDKNEAHRIIYNALSLGVKRQLIADAPIGVFLSGGIDSSLLTLLANRQKKEQLKTISIFFDEKSYDERSYQNIINNKINGQNFSHLVKQSDFEAVFSQIIGAMDMPTTDGINSWFISKYAHDDGLKAVLSGVGADELFGGYPSFNRIKYLGYLRKLPSWMLKISGHFLPDHYKRLAFLAVNHPVADYLALRGLFSLADVSALLDTSIDHINDVLFGAALSPAPHGYNNEHAEWFETHFYMQNQLLRDTDIMSMNHGLEVRVPFLDEDFNRAARNIAPAIRFNKRQPKKLLIESFDNLIPPEVWNRPKMGFTFPLQKWMKEHQLISDTDNYKGKAAQNAIKQFKNDSIHWSKAFALYQVQNDG
ncbi:MULTISPECIES: asparagine synthase (glutamine-hydrolyzing) [Mucilaginibacter]|uniref:asparagine synthase (glutamine-hydrolyzing) n=1 Tax=Mucilaginibacter TaxID=423349 RepID=UPI00159D1255|nr:MULTISPECIES: asparagine synthase (glutamine-hydrolyzing) [Mucilaginibacter]NVM63714.1 asparagine synthase (glutamine-hydrolyzing) [Mucilaginibacter sp. SG538B]GGB25622.1 asparagine synthetase B [Mucilaginibacter rubeus]